MLKLFTCTSSLACHTICPEVWKNVVFGIAGENIFEVSPYSTSSVVTVGTLVVNFTVALWELSPDLIAKPFKLDLPAFVIKVSACKLIRDDNDETEDLVVP